MAEAVKNTDLEEQAVAELLKEATRGREREKTLGTEGWRSRPSRPNQLFIGRSIASALRQTRYAQKARFSNLNEKKLPSYNSKSELKEVQSLEQVQNTNDNTGNEVGRKRCHDDKKRSITARALPVHNKKTRKHDCY